MYDVALGHTKESLIWKGEDYMQRTVCLFVPERDHILDGHNQDVANDFTKIYDSVSDPDFVYKSLYDETRDVCFKQTHSENPNPKFYTKTVVEYSGDKTKGVIVTSML